MTPADFPPMPDFLCPSWCQTDHEGDWQQHVAVGLDVRRVPAAGGGFLQGNPLPIEEWCTLPYFDPFHHARIGSAALTEGGGVEEVVVDVQQSAGTAPSIYIRGEGLLTTAGARRLAAMLLDVADQIDRDEL